jgi:hypothetical protein
MDSAEQMTELAVSVGEKESLSVASRCLGIYAMGTENWSAAIQYLQDAVAIMRELGRLDSETETQLLLSLSLHRQDGQSGALEDIARIEDIVNSGKIPKLSPLVALAKSEIERGRHAGEEAAEAVETLWNHGRVVDLVELTPWAFGVFTARQRKVVKKKLLSAVERIASSLDDALLRKQFLAFPVAKKALQVVRD